MKRRVLFIFILIFWMIALSTFLSVRVEEWMMPYISTTKTEPQDVHKEIPADALFYDDAGVHIYHVRNGQGWESGLRVYEVERADYFVIDGKVRFSQADGEFVRYASRTLRVGEEVRQPENVFLTEDDNWVAVFPEGIPKYELKTTKMSAETKTDTSMIVCAPNTGVPFMEDRARSMVIVEKEDSDWYEPHTSRFYSLGELKTFMNNLLLLGVLTAMMIFTVILWAWSFWLSREYITNRSLLIINSAVSAGLLALSPLLLHFIDLPTSMLPQYHITDLSHYRQFFGELFRELNRLTDADSEIAAAAVKHTKQSGMFFVVLVVCGVLFGVTAIILEAILSKHRKIGGQKMKHRMYRKISLILAVLLLITMFTGCAEKETGPLKICVDLGSFSAVYEPGRGNGMADGNQQHAMQMFEANLKGYLQMNSLDPIELEIEYIPEHTPEGNPERDTTIAHLRTEIMSGKGPDIFLLGTNSRDIEPLFKVPEKNMVNGAFLPLNDYIENAQFMEFDKLVPGVMSAGQYDDEQYILPLTYTLPLTIYNASEVQDTPSKTMMWEQMLEGDEYLRNAACFVPETGLIDCFLLNSLGQVADYENDKLLLTEKELFERIEEMIALENIKFNREDAKLELPTNCQVDLCYGFDQLAKWRGDRPDPQDPFAGKTDPSLAPLEDPFTIVPMYSDDGGAMATVLTYAAINANTKQPEKAFFVLDYLFGLKSQQSSPVFHLTCLDAIPVHMDLLQEEYPLKYLGTYNLHEGTYKELREIQELITGATFSGELYYELESMYSKCTYAYRKGESYEGIVAETYNTLRQIVAE